MHRDAFEHGLVAQCVLDRAGRVVEANAPFARLCGTEPEALRGRRAGDLIEPADGEALASGQAEHRMHDAWVLSQVAVAGDLLVWQCVDITDRRADQDPLSGVATRTRFEDELDRALRRARRYGGRVGVAMIDLDGFKQINDTEGHAAGDEVIVAVGRALEHATRDTDVVGRLGGDEFAVLLPSTDEPGAAHVAATLLDAVRPARVTGSIGIAVSRDDGADTTDELLRAADAAMYDAKEAGGDRFVVARSGFGGLDLRLAWVERLRVAEAAGRLRLHAQPVVPFTPDGVPHHELLLRYVRDDGELVVPGRFLDVAEAFGLAPAIDRWVLGRAVALLRAEHAAGRPRRLSVNISRATLGRSLLAAELAALLEEAALPPGALTIEVTETAVVADLERAAEVLSRLRAIGVRISLDDFGTGTSSLAELRHIPVDELKIDGAFVRGVAHAGPDRVIVEAVVHLARGLGARTVGEVVADAAAHDALRAAGVDAAQGYHVGMPLPIEDVLARAA